MTTIMKRIVLALVAVMAMTFSASAMSYSTARSQALFLTDKMAYELNLSDDQYNAVYEINLDYMLSVAYQEDLFGSYWSRRNTDLGYVLSTLQYTYFKLQDYFYRPITWVSNKFYYGIYNHYDKNRYFRGAPAGYDTYRGANRYYNQSPYSGRTFYTKGNEPKPRSTSHQPQQYQGGAHSQQPQGGAQQGQQKPQGGAQQGQQKPQGGAQQGGTRTQPQGGAQKGQGQQQQQRGGQDFQYNKRQSVNQGKQDFGGSNPGGRRR